MRVAVAKRETASLQGWRWCRHRPGHAATRAADARARPVPGTDAQAPRMKASRSRLMTSAWVVHMPCEYPL